MLLEWEKLSHPTICRQICFRLSHPQALQEVSEQSQTPHHSQTSPAVVTPQRSIKAAATHASKGSGPLIYTHDSVVQLAAVTGLIWKAAWLGSTSLK